MRLQSSVKISPVILWLMMGLMILLPHRVQSNTHESVATDSHIGLPVVAAAGTANGWWNSAWDYRIPVTVDTNGYRRTDKPVEVALNFTSLFNSLGTSGIFAPDSLRVVEVDEAGQVLDDSLALQFDEAADYDPSTNAAGTLIFLLGGVTAANSQRTFHVYFDKAGQGFAPPLFNDLVVRSDVIDTYSNGAFDSYQFDTPGGTYVYHKHGGGFAKLIDPAGNDWISYRHDVSNAGGTWRGIPNFDDTLHPGFNFATTTAVASGPLKETFRTISHASPGNLTWEVLWEIYPTYAKLTVLQAYANYWFLYEGTPGGLLETEAGKDFYVLSDGTQLSAGTVWPDPDPQDLPNPEWVYFADPGVGRALYLVNHQHNDGYDSYRTAGSGTNKMTVFGFGRQRLGTSYKGMSRNQLPAYFTIGLMDQTAYQAAAEVIDAAFRELSITVGTAQQQATSTSTPTPTSTSTPSPTNTPTSTSTSTHTALSTHTPTLTPTMIPVEPGTDTPSPTVTPTAPDLLTPTPTVTPTAQPTIDAPGEAEQRLFLPLISK